MGRSATLMVVLFVGPAILLWQRVPDRIERPLIPEGMQGTPVPARLYIKQMSSTLNEAQAALRFPDLAALLSAPRLELMTATYGAPARMIEARATLEGTNCTYDTDSAQDLPNNRPLVLTRSSSCEALQGTPTGLLLLRIAYRGDRGIALWTRTTPAVEAAAGVPKFEAPAFTFADTAAMLEGSFVTISQGSHTRAQLLAYMWRSDTSAAWLWATLGAAAVLAAVGTWLIGSGGRFSAVPTALLSLSLGLSYAVLSPPLQAPDEPTHLLTFALVTGQRQLADEAARWGWRSHFERIRFHPDQHFLSSSLGRPSLRSWTLVTTQDAARSAATARLWWLAAAIVPEMRVENWLLVLRLLNAVVFAAAMAAVARAGGTGEFNPAFPLLLVPTLPFFAMHVSNHALLAVGDVLIAGAAAIGFWRPERAGAAGGILVAGQVLAIASGRLGLGAVPIVVAIAAAWLVFNSETSRRFMRGGAAGACILPAVAGPAYLLAIFETIRAAGVQAGGWMLGVVPAVVSRPSRISPLLVRRLAVAGACAPLLLLLASTVVPMPMLPPARTTTLLGYMGHALAAAATFPRLSGRDLLMADTFWGGFGWLDTYPADAFLTAMPVLTALLLSAILFRVARRADGRQLGWLGFVAVGVAASVLLLAAGSYLYAPELHGRYLLAAYLPPFAVIWGAFATQRWATALTFAVAVVHGLCLSTIVVRYF